jgi:hypothetical protein
VFVFQVMPRSWQLSQALARTAVCFMTVPAKVVKLVTEWHSSQAILPTGMCPVGPVGGSTSVGGAMFANESPLA